MEAKEKSEQFRRFGAGRIIEHWLLIILILVLAVTGLAQRFHEFWLSRWVISAMGGITASRFVHHMAGFAFMLLMVQHILVASLGILSGRWAPSMMISLKDFRDALHNVKYYLGLESSPARCGRYDYKEKFVYWLVLTGGIQMVVTGFMLWYPVAATRFLPGQFIPAAKEMHANEAMLIFVLIAIWHMYDSIFNPDVFPIDTSIFSGYIERERVEKAHPLELEYVQDTEGAENQGMAVNPSVDREDLTSDVVPRPDS